jgi:hypothetical protein
MVFGDGETRLGHPAMLTVCETLCYQRSARDSCVLVMDFSCRASVHRAGRASRYPSQRGIRYSRSVCVLPSWRSHIRCRR